MHTIKIFIAGLLVGIFLGGVIWADRDAILAWIKKKVG